MRGLQVNGHSDISQYQWHTRSQSGSIPPREPKLAYTNICPALRCVLFSPCISQHNLGVGYKANQRPALLLASHCLHRKVQAKNLPEH